MKRTWILGLVAAGTLLGAGAAQASDVHWSIGVNLPPVATVISGGPAYFPAPPVVYAPPIRYAPPVVYEEPVYQGPTVVYREPRPYYRAPTVVYRSERPYWDGRGRGDWRGDRDGLGGHDRDDRGQQRHRHD
jgi:hypothetical protein